MTLIQKPDFRDVYFITRVHIVVAMGDGRHRGRDTKCDKNLVKIENIKDQISKYMFCILYIDMFSTFLIIYEYKNIKTWSKHNDFQKNYPVLRKHTVFVPQKHLLTLSKSQKIMSFTLFMNVLLVFGGIFRDPTSVQEYLNISRSGIEDKFKSET